MLRCCVSHLPKVTILGEVLVCMRMATSLSFLSGLYIYSPMGKDLFFCLFFWSKAPKGLLNSSPLLFIQWASQTQIVFVQSSRHCHVVFTKGYATMCSVCRMTTKAWSVIYARVTCFFLISLMISSDINFNKFLRIRWCMLISAWEWGRISAAWTNLFIKDFTLPCGSNSTTWGLHLNTFTTTGSYHWSH